MSARFVDLPAGRFHYRRWPAGPAAPQAILVHGNGSSWTTWARIGPPMNAAGVDVFAVDLRGCGSSVRFPAGSYGLPAIADDLHDFITALDIRRPVLIGHCWGAAAALMLATGASRDQAPAALGGLVLEELPRDMACTPDQPVVRDFLRLMSRPPEYVQKWAELTCRSWDPVDRRNLVDDILATDPDIYLSAVRDGAGAGPLFPRLARLDIPAMVIRGNPRRGGMLDDADWRLVRRHHLFGADAHEFESSGHEVHRTDQRQFVRLVTDFVHKTGSDGEGRR